MKNTHLLTALGLLGSLTTSQAAFSLLDDFESYMVGDISPQSANWTFDTADGTVAESGGNKYLVQGPTSNGHTVFNNSTTLLADGAVGTYFFRALMPTGGSHNGTSPSAREGFTNGWSDGGAIVRLGQSGGSTNIWAYNENTGANGNYDNLASGTAEVWYNFWVVLDNANHTHDVYLQSDGDAAFNTQQQIANDLAFRVDANTVTGSIESIFFRSANDGLTAQFDDLYFDGTGLNLINPVPEPSVALLGALGMLGLLRRKR